MSEFAQMVLGLVRRPDYTPITLKEMSRRFEIEPDDYAEFRAAVKALIREGRLDLGKDKTLRNPAAQGAIIGLFRRSAKGFGFVRPHKTVEKSEQIFIPANAGRDASTGDEVVVKITKRSKGPGMNPEGRIVQVLVRASGVFVGTYYERGGSGYVKIDGTTFSDPVFVGDPGAKGAKPGDKVALEMARYPSPALEGEGVISEVLGPRGQPGVDTLSVIRAFNIPDVFDDDTLDDAREQARHFSEDDLKDRLDLRDTLTVTIDPATARDFDDAITLSRDDRGYWQLGVHIADVAHFVKTGSSLDQSARLRGTSVYLPDRVIPMLPEVISNSLASLQAGRVRYTMSALIEFNAEGVRTDHRFARSAIRVDQRFSYEQAFAVMKAPGEPHEGTAPEVVAQLSRMLELAMILRKRRFQRGALELTMPEIQIDLGAQGEVTGAHLASHDESHQVIEEFMLAANEAVATFLSGKDVAFLRRGHADPEPRKLLEFAEFARSLGYKIDKPQSRFALQELLAESAQKPEAHAIHYGLLRSFKQATYTPEPEGHYALASENYCHFTSPIRRYPDLQVHRQLAALIAGKKPKGNVDELTVLAEHCNRTERRAEAAEREIIKIKLLTYLQQKIGEHFHSVITAVEDFGLFCRLVELPADGLVHVTSLGDDFFYLEAGTHTLIGRRTGRKFRLGDKVEVTIVRVDVDRRELDLILTQRGASGEPIADEAILASVRANRPRAPRPAPPQRSSKPDRAKPKGPKGKKGRKKGK